MTVATYWIPGGQPGVEATIGHMRRIARSSLADPLLVEKAGSIVRGAYTERARALAVRGFLESFTEFLPDPPGIELVRTPQYMLREIRRRGVAQGDCDDVAVWGAALGMAVGLPARFSLLAFTPAGPHEHVYTELLTNQGPVELDTTKPAQFPPGLRVFNAATREV